MEWIQNGKTVGHYGVLKGTDTPKQKGPYLHWEFVGKNRFASGDVYVFTYFETLNGETEVTKTVIFKGKPVEVKIAEGVRVSIDESDQDN